MNRANKTQVTGTPYEECNPDRGPKPATTATTDAP